MELLHFDQNQKAKYTSLKKLRAETFLVVLWLRICLPMQGTLVQSLV